MLVYGQHVKVSQDGHGSLVSQGFKSFSPLPFRKIYAKLLEAVRTLYESNADITSDLQASLDDVWPMMLAAMEIILSMEMDGKYTPESQGAADRRAMQQEIIKVMNTFHTAKEKQPRASALWKATQIVDEPEGLLALLEMVEQCTETQATLFDATPEAASVFCNALGSVSNKLRIQALRTVAAHADTWLDGHLGQRFSEAGLVSRLVKCVRVEEDWPAIAPYLARIVKNLAHMEGGEEMVIGAFLQEMQVAHAHGRVRLAGAVLYLWYQPEPLPAPEKPLDTNLELKASDNHIDQATPLPTLDQIPSASESDEKGQVPSDEKAVTLPPSEDHVDTLVQHVLNRHFASSGAKRDSEEDDHTRTYDMVASQIPGEGRPFLAELEPVATT